MKETKCYVRAQRRPSSDARFGEGPYEEGTFQQKAEGGEGADCAEN